MQRLVTDAMREGALGVGSALIYAPAFYARPEELEGRLVKVETAHAAALERRRRVSETLALLDKPKPDLRTIHATIQRYGLGNDPSITAALEKPDLAPYTAAPAEIDLLAKNDKLSYGAARSENTGVQ